MDFHACLNDGRSPVLPEPQQHFRWRIPDVHEAFFFFVVQTSYVFPPSRKSGQSDTIDGELAMTHGDQLYDDVFEYEKTA